MNNFKKVLFILFDYCKKLDLVLLAGWQIANLSLRICDFLHLIRFEAEIIIILISDATYKLDLGSQQTHNYVLHNPGR